MRQLVAALEYRFQSLEEQESTIPDTEFDDNLDALFAPIIHTHVVADILDFEENVPSSIFDLDDVTGIPIIGESLIWDGDEFVPGTAGGTLALGELTDVHLPSPEDTQILTYVEANNRWEAVGSIGGDDVDNLFDLTDTNLELVPQQRYDMLFNADGSEWQNTGGRLQWNPFEGLTLVSNLSISWEDVLFNSTELLTFEEVQVATGDADFASVGILLPLDGTDAATTTTDLSNFAHTVTFNDDAQLDTAQSKFGTASLLLDGILDNLSIPNDASFSPGAESLTVEVHVRFARITGARMMIASIYQNAGNNKEWAVAWTPGGSFSVPVSVDGTTDLSAFLEPWSAAVDTWYHIAVVIDRDGVTDVTRVFIDGVRLAADDTAIDAWPALNQNGSVLRIGQYDSGTFDRFDGHIDNVRITKGVARYKDDFTPPIAPYPTGTGGVSTSNQFTVGDPAYATRIDGTQIDLANNVGINWEDSEAVPQEFLIFATGVALEGDPEWAKTTFLAPLSGDDGSTIASDFSPLAHPDATFFFGATISDEVLRYGENTLKLDGTNYIEFPSHVGFAGELDPDDDSETGDWTCEMDVYWTAQPSGSQLDCFISKYSSAERQWRLGLDANRIEARVTNIGGGGGVIFQIHNFVPVVNTWYTICWEIWRQFSVHATNDQGNIFVDGVRIGTKQVDGLEIGFNVGNKNLRIGAWHFSTDTSPANPFTGHIANIRFTKGLARYKGVDYTPPTAPYPIGVDPVDENTFVVGDPNIQTRIDGSILSLEAQTRIDVPHGIGINWDDAVGDLAELLSFAGTAGNEIFSVGNPLYDTIIAGLTTNITSVATDIDGTLNVDGVATLVDTLNVQGAVDLDTTLNVDGEASFQDDVSLSDVSAVNFDANEMLVLAAGASGNIQAGDRDWSSVSFLANFDGDDADAFYTSEDDALRTATFVSTAQLDTAQFKFGTASLLLDGISDYVTFPDSADWEFGSGDFTLECDVRFNGDPSGGGTQTFLTHWQSDGDDRSWLFGYIGADDELRVTTSSDGTNGGNILTAGAWNPVGEQWYHIAASRSGDDMRLFVDGVQVGAGTDGNNIHPNAEPLMIGALDAFGPIVNFVDGWIDNVRITKGVARYTVDFTPPTEAYPSFDSNWDSTTLLANFDRTDGTTTYTSEDDTGHVLTFFSTAEISTTQSKFGGSSLFLDGVSDYVTVPHNTNIGVLNGEDITIEFWLRATSLITNSRTILNKSGVQGSIWPNWNSSMQSDETVKFGIYFNGGAINEVFSTTSLVVGEWAHIALVWDDHNDTAYIYFNGVLEDYDKATGTIFDNGAALFIGVQDADNRYFPGNIDDLRITKAVLHGRVPVPREEYTPADEPSAVLFNFNGADAATAYTSEDASATVVTFLGSAQLDDADISRRNGSTGLLCAAIADRVTIPAANVTLGSGDFGIELWIRPTTSVVSKVLYDQRIANPSAAAPVLYMQASGFFSWHISAVDRITGTTAAVIGQWHHVVVQRVNGVTRLYVDGLQEGEHYVDSNNYLSQTLTFGGRWDGTTGFQGSLDGFRVLVGAPLYPMNFTPPTEAYPTEDTDWGAVAFLANFDGADGDTTYTSEDGGQRVATFEGSAEIDTAQFKFGTSSAFFDGTTDWIHFPDSDDFSFGAGQFTVEGWWRFNGDPGTGSHLLVAHYDHVANERSWLIELNNNELWWAWTTDGNPGTYAQIDTPWNPVGDQWYHLAVTRDASNDLRIFVDGAVLTTVANAVTYHPATSTLSVGGTATGNASMLGWIDEVRVTKGVARYTAAFTPVSSALVGAPAASGAAATGVFTVGDPLIVTQIDGPTTQVTGELEFLGKLSANVTTVITTTHTAADEHVILVDDDTAAATVTVTLPAAETAKTIYQIKKLGTTASVIIDGDASELIDGALTITLNAQYESVMLVSDGTFWSII
jgi:hypothetical protein